MIRDIPPEQAALLVPLNIVVQNLHAAHRPDIYPADPDRQALAAHLAELLARPGWFALGWTEVPEATPLLGYVLCEVQDVPATPLRHAQRRGMLHHIAVAQEARRQGIGRALVEAAKARFRAGGAAVWAVTYQAFNTPSQRLMARAGATPGLILADGPL